MRHRGDVVLPEGAAEQGHLNPDGGCGYTAHWRGHGMAAVAVRRAMNFPGDRVGGFWSELAGELVRDGLYELKRACEAHACSCGILHVLAETESHAQKVRAAWVGHQDRFPEWSGRLHYNVFAVPPEMPLYRHMFPE